MEGNHISTTRRKTLVAGVGVLAALAGCSDTDDTAAEESIGGGEEGSDAQSTASAETDDASESGSESASEESNQQQEANVKLGEMVEGENLSMVAREVTKTEKISEFTEAESGNTFAIVRMAVKNTGSEFVDFNSFLQARLKDNSNHVYDASFGSTGHPIESGILAAGEVARGDVVFEVPKDARGLTMQFDFSTFDFFEFERVTVDLESKADSIQDLEQSLQVDVHSPGDAVDHEDVSVTLHGVRTETELGSFTQAEDGNEYVIPDIEITNNTEEPLSVSTVLQMRVKDGSGLAFMADIGGSSQLSQGYSEGSEIAPGESRRGELAYQLEQGTSPLYWAFNFLNLSNEMKAFWELR
ncbi:DUF4352 domain-containing protein [Haloprofundus salinisoli]|uniref:DUF4352 domain-containing protein n=1 Tax=Haloprofundus salinisoli TaxID=2876193 RepID=UPI001CC9FE86|nr:DUF4352 domain-containing protein [Haloprofundus salinisoli]